MAVPCYLLKLCCMLQARVSIVEAAKATEKLPWKWIALALCLAALTGAAYHTRHQWQGPLSQRVHQMEMHARSQLGDAKAYFQGPVQKQLHGWAHSVRQGFHRQRCPLVLLPAQALIPMLAPSLVWMR